MKIYPPNSVRLLSRYLSIIEAALWTAAGVCVVLILARPAGQPPLTLLAMLAALLALAIQLLFHVYIPRAGLNERSLAGITLVALALATFLSYLLNPYAIVVHPLLAAIIAIVAISGTRRFTVISALLAGLALAFLALLNVPLTPQALLSLALSTGILVGFGWVLNEFSAQLIGQANQSQRMAQSLAVANEIGKAISSTIEMDDLLELIYEQLTRSIPSDTYYVGLYHTKQKTLEIRILIDDGVRFTPETVPLGNGLATWVLTSRQPLLIRHLSLEEDQLPVRPIHMGTSRVSESWLGVPMIARGRPLGILAIASYTPNAFGMDDQMLLANIAAQAALSIDNAHQHAEVKEQARRDSLTGAYNHGHLLRLLNHAVESCRSDGCPVSLIMLDIDYFKQYNDLYGHQVGDEVLVHLIQAIQSHVKQTDIVGRWGGEEFAIGLPQANTGQAVVVAERIRQTLAETIIYDRANQRIASPTVSQGIATFPAHAPDSSALVDVADQALYRAKESGRDTIIAVQSTG